MKQFNPDLFNPNDLCKYMMRVVEENRDKINPQTGDPDKIIFCNEGGSRCFHKDTMVSTPNGAVKISDLSEFDEVYSYNTLEKKQEVKRVISSNLIKNDKKCYEIRLKNGKKIICSEDHEFFHQGKFIEIKNLLSLHKLKI